MSKVNLTVDQLRDTMKRKNLRLLERVSWGMIPEEMSSWSGLKSGDKDRGRWRSEKDIFFLTLNSYHLFFVYLFWFWDRIVLLAQVDLELMILQSQPPKSWSFSMHYCTQFEHLVLFCFVPLVTKRLVTHCLWSGHSHSVGIRISQRQRRNICFIS